MNRPHRTVLSWIVERYDTTGQPVTPGEAAAHFGRDIETVRSCFEYLEENHLLQSTGSDGYRPTVTARELLELDIDDERFLVLDPDSETE